MKKKIMVVMCSLLLATPILSFAQNKKAPNPGLSANEYAKERASLSRSKNLDNNEAHKAARRAKRRADKKAEGAKRKSDMKTGSDAQVSVRF